MKKIITTIVLTVSIAVAGIAQTAPTKKTTDESTSCYAKWAQKFEDRAFLFICSIFSIIDMKTFRFSFDLLSIIIRPIDASIGVT